MNWNKVADEVDQIHIRTHGIKSDLAMAANDFKFGPRYKLENVREDAMLILVLAEEALRRQADKLRGLLDVLGPESGSDLSLSDEKTRERLTKMLKDTYQIDSIEAAL